MYVWACFMRLYLRVCACMCVMCACAHVCECVCVCVYVCLCCTCLSFSIWPQNRRETAGTQSAEAQALFSQVIVKSSLKTSHNYLFNQQHHQWFLHNLALAPKLAMRTASIMSMCMHRKRRKPLRLNMVETIFMRGGVGLGTTVWHIERMFQDKGPEAPCRENPGEVWARTCGTKSPSRSEALRSADSAKSQSTKIDGSLVNFKRRLSNRHRRPRRLLIWTFEGNIDRTVSTSTWFAQVGSSVLIELSQITGSAKCMRGGSWPGYDSIVHWKKVSRQKPGSNMSWKTPGEVRARTCGTKSPSRSEALRFIDSSKSPSTKIDGSLVNFKRRLANRHGRPRWMLIWTFGDSPISVSFKCPYQQPPQSPVSIGKPAPKIHQWTIYFVGGDLAESIKRSASDRLGDLVPQVQARTSPGFFTTWRF